MKTAGKHVRKLSLVLLILLTLPLLFPFRTAVCAAEAGKMTEVILSSDGKTLTVSAVIPEETVKEAGKRPFLLFALAPGERPEDAEPVAETAPSVSPTASVPCAGSELDLLFRGYLFALREEDGRGVRGLDGEGGEGGEGAADGGPAYDARRHARHPHGDRPAFGSDRQMDRFPVG